MEDYEFQPGTFCIKEKKKGLENAVGYTFYYLCLVSWFDLCLMHADAIQQGKSCDRKRREDSYYWSKRVR